MMQLLEAVCHPRRLAAAIGLGLVLTTSAARADHQEGNLVQVLQRNGHFTTLLAALNAAGLKDTVATGGNFTLFAPTDEAFGDLPPGTVESLLADIPALRKVLLYHVVGEPESIQRLVRQGSVETLEGSEVTVSRKQGKLFVNDAPVLHANVRAANGMIHVIGGVLQPAGPKPNLVETLSQDGRFTTLIAALKLTGLDSVVATGGTFTIFAPTDDAFAAVPEDTLNALLANPNALKNVLLSHAVAGEQSARDLLRESKVKTLQGQSVCVYKRFGQVFVNRSRVIEANVEAENGLIHVIDQVLLPR